MLHGHPADLDAVTARLSPALGRVDNHIHAAGLDHILEVGVRLSQTIDLLNVHIHLFQVFIGALGSEQLYAQVVQLTSDTHCFALVLVLDGDDDAAALLGHLHVGALEGFQQCLGIGLGNAQAPG